MDLFGQLYQFSIIFAFQVRIADFLQQISKFAHSEGNAESTCICFDAIAGNLFVGLQIALFRLAPSHKVISVSANDFDFLICANPY